MNLDDQDSPEFQKASKEVANAVNDLMAVMGTKRGQNTRTILTGVFAAASVYGLVTKPDDLSTEEATMNMAKLVLQYAHQYAEVMEEISE